VNGRQPTLSRAALAEAGTPCLPAPVRIVHFGLGAFHRAHQAWYTARAHDAADWGIAALTGRNPTAAEVLARQDGLYTLVERGPHGDRDQIVGSLVEAVDGADLGRLLALFRSERLAIVTFTVTEAGYRLRSDGSPDLEDAILAEDLRTLRAAFQTGDAEGHLPASTLGRLLVGLEARRRSGGGPLALVSCDNLPDNGGHLERGTTAAAGLVSDRLADWIDGHVAFVSTSVDRITPRVTAHDVAELDATSRWRDEAPVFTEPFSDWVLSGTFPAGRPAWEDAGARFVDDIEPWERRKLWLLNGAHTLLSFAGPLLGHETVAQAIADPRLLDAVERFWDEAERHLPSELDLTAYRSALLERFANPRIEHRLDQIAQDGTRKLQLRIVPVAEAELEAGRTGAGCAAAVAAWCRRPEAAEATTRERIGLLSPVLAGDAGFVAAVEAAEAAAAEPA
jgi:fructuronate reductase